MCHFKKSFKQKLQHGLVSAWLHMFMSVCGTSPAVSEIAPRVGVRVFFFFFWWLQQERTRGVSVTEFPGEISRGATAAAPNAANGDGDDLIYLKPV